MSEEQDRSAGLLDDQASRVTERSEENAGLCRTATAERFVETSA